MFGMKVVYLCMTNGRREDDGLDVYTGWDRSFVGIQRWMQYPIHEYVPPLGPRWQAPSVSRSLSILFFRLPKVEF